MTGLRRTLFGLLGLSLMVGPAWSGGAGADMAREDWYLRESLSAIRDWEEILARWEKTVPEAERTPLLPVPADGQAVQWPNPIPRMLLPAKDRDAAVHLRLVGGKMEVERVAGGWSPAFRRSGSANTSTRPPAKAGTPTEAGTGSETAAPGAEVLGYKHFGGGGKDQWYHRYFRKFDRLTTFRPTPAPFALRIDSPLELRRGKNELAVEVRNCGAEALGLELQLEFHSPKESHPCGHHSIALAAGAARTAHFPVEIGSPGGGLLILRVATGKGAFWLPLLTHAEDIGPVLESIEQILADTPDPQGAARLAALRQRVEAWRPEKGTGTICAKHPLGRSGKSCLSPFLRPVARIAHRSPAGSRGWRGEARVSPLDSPSSRAAESPAGLP